jgi:hypothetical protein
MTSWDEWWELAIAALRSRSMDADRLVEMYRADGVQPERPPTEVFGYVRDIESRLRGELAPYIVMAAGDWMIRTPDDVWMEPAWNDLEVEMLWNRHDGRSYGTMVVAVYKWDGEAGAYGRDLSRGLMGKPGKTGAAEYPADALCSDGEEE